MHIVWQTRAISDLYRVVEQIRQDHPAAAEKMGAAIEAACKNLTRYPQMGRTGRVAETRELIVSGTPYFVVYRISGEAVQILSVLHDRQKWPSL